MSGGEPFCIILVKPMDRSRVAVIVESDVSARQQMSAVLGEMEVAVVHAADLREAAEVAAQLVRSGNPPDAIVARVTLPDGSGVQALDRLAELFPLAHQVLVSHYPKRLLFSLPGFASRRAEFLQAKFTDDQFRKVMQRALASKATGGA